MKLRTNVSRQLAKERYPFYYCANTRNLSQAISSRSKKYGANTLGISDAERSELLSQSKIEDSHLYFQSILNTRKKMATITETNSLTTVHQLSDEYKQSLEDSAILWQNKKDKIRKNYALTDLDRILNKTKLLSMKLPSRELEHYLNACRIAALLRLDPVKDKALIQLKKRIQWVCMTHRLNAVPPLDFFVKHRYWDVVEDSGKYGTFAHVVSLIGLKPLVYLPNNKHLCCIPSVSTVSPFLSPTQQRREWKKLQNECLKIDLKILMNRKQVSRLPPRSDLIKYKRFDLERRIQKLGGHCAASKILNIPYKARRSARHWQKLQNVAKELKLYCKETGARSNVLPTRLELFASGFGELGNRLLGLHKRYSANSGGMSIRIALNKETNLDLIERPEGYEPPFVEQSQRYENISRLLQELFLIISTRNDTFNDDLMVSDIIDMKRYDLVVAIQKYHGGYGRIRSLFPGPPKPTTYWDDIDNVAKEVRRMMRLFDQQVMPQANQLTYSGNGWLRECIEKHGGFESFAEYIHAEANLDENLEERDVEGYWDNLETIYDELMTFIYDTEIDFMPSKLELLSGGYEKLWRALIPVAKQEHQTQLIKLKTKQFKKQFKSKYKMHPDKKENTELFQMELEKELMLLKKNQEFDKTLSEIEVLQHVSRAYKIPINSTFEGRCKFAVSAAQEWKDFGALAKELMAFYRYYTETCFTINREFVDHFTLPLMEDMAYCMRPDLNYAILRWHGGHKRVENRIRTMKVIDLYHPMYGEGKSKDQMLYLEHGTVWQFKALPPPPASLTESNLMIADQMDPMFLPQALATQDMIDPTAKIVKNKQLTKRIRDKKVTLLLS
eukprot:146796_1